MSITSELLDSAGVTKEQSEAFRKKFPKGASLSYETLKNTGWRVDWLAVLIEWPRRASVYAEIDATFTEFDFDTRQQMATWKAQQRYFQSIIPAPDKRMQKAAWVPYKKLKESAEYEYEVFTERAFCKMHDAQARIIAKALDKSSDLS